MPIFYEDDDGFLYWAIDLPETFSVPAAETSLTFIVGSQHRDEPITDGDVIYGFINDRLVISCVIDEMLTPLSLQATLSAQHLGAPQAELTFTVVRAHVMPVRPAVLYKPGLLHDDQPLQESIRHYLERSRQHRCVVGGVAWSFDLGVGNDMLTILDDDFVQRQGRDGRDAGGLLRVLEETRHTIYCATRTPTRPNSPPSVVHYNAEPDLLSADAPALREPSQCRTQAGTNQDRRRGQSRRRSVTRRPKRSERD